MGLSADDTPPDFDDHITEPNFSDNGANRPSTPPPQAFFRSDEPGWAEPSANIEPEETISHEADQPSEERHEMLPEAISEVLPEILPKILPEVLPEETIKRLEYERSRGYSWEYRFPCPYTENDDTVFRLKFCPDRGTTWYDRVPSSRKQRSERRPRRASRLTQEVTLEDEATKPFEMGVASPSRYKSGFSWSDEDEEESDEFLREYLRSNAIGEPKAIAPPPSPRPSLAALTETQPPQPDDLDRANEYFADPQPSLAKARSLLKDKQRGHPLVDNLAEDPQSRIELLEHKHTLAHGTNDHYERHCRHLQSVIDDLTRQKAKLNAMVEAQAEHIEKMNSEVEHLIDYQRSREQQLQQPPPPPPPTEELYIAPSASAALLQAVRLTQPDVDNQTLRATCHRWTARLNQLRQTSSYPHLLALIRHNRATFSQP